jgi:nucleotide-binding universal stress UspA family protein
MAEAEKKETKQGATDVWLQGNTYREGAMFNIQRIVVPVDFHRHTNDMAEYAIGIAKNLDAKPTFLHIVENFAKIAGYSETCPTCLIDAYEEMHSRAQKKMTALLEQFKGDCPGCGGVVLRGERDAADEIVDYVKDQKADLIIMGTHGARGIEKILLGSVTQNVVKRASCPILIYNPYKGERGYTGPMSEAKEPVEA